MLHPHDRRTAARRVDRGPARRPGVVGDQRERQHPPARVGDDARQRVGCRSTIRSWPADNRRPRGRRRCRGSGWTACRCRPRCGSRSTSGRSLGWSLPAAALTDLIEGLCGQPVVDGQPAGVQQPCVAGVDLGGSQAGRAPPARRRRNSADRSVRRRPHGRSTRPSRCRSLFIISRSRSISGGDCTDAISWPPSQGPRAAP